MKTSPEYQLQNKVLTTQQVREVDRMAISGYGMNSLVLMENAGLGCVQWIARRFPRPQKTVILCGPGNNGGDGLVIARHLRNRGWDCRALLLGPEEKFSPDTRHHFEILSANGGSGVRVVTSLQSEVEGAELLQAQLIVDAMLGTGATGNPRPPLSQWIELANASNAHRLAIDVPTGINADTGKCGRPAFRADSTLTFVSLKPGMVAVDATESFGTIQVVPIGIPEQLILRLL